MNKNYNIIFAGFTDNKIGIQFYSYNTDVEKTITVKIIDGHTGLIYHQSKHIVYPNIINFVCHDYNINHLKYIISDEFDKKIFFQVENINGIGFDIRSIDKYDILRDYDYDGERDNTASHPLYEIFINKIYENEDCKIDDGDVVFDIGGNIGLFSYYAVCMKAKYIYSFEPVKELYDTCIRNFKFLDNIKFENMAISNKNSTVKIFYHRNSSAQSSIENVQNNVIDNKFVYECQCRDIMSYLKDNIIPKINYLKMDCEGSEYDIFKSLTVEYLSNNIDKICLEFHHNENGKLNNILNKLDESGFGYVFDGNSNRESYQGMIYSVNNKYKQK